MKRNGGHGGSEQLWRISKHPTGTGANLIAVTTPFAPPAALQQPAHPMRNAEGVFCLVVLRYS